MKVKQGTTFDKLIGSLSGDALASDVGYYVRMLQGTCVNNLREGRISTVKERLEYLKAKMTERRTGRFETITLAKLFPKDWEIINKLKP